MTDKATDVRNREDWLQRATELLTPMIEDAGGEVPQVRVSVGFPKGRRGRSRAIGQCWSNQSATDGVNNLFVCPTLDDAIEVLGVLLHELIHATVGVDAGHKGPFVMMSREVGLLRPWTATTPGDDLRDELTKLYEVLGAYPHQAMKVPATRKKGSTLKLWECECEPTVKLRVGKAEINVRCLDCGSDFLPREV